MKLESLRDNQNLINAIDWHMTPTEAVRLYLEWGNNWASGNYVIRYREDVSHYFVVNTWKGRPIIYLIRRNSDDAKNWPVSKCRRTWPPVSWNRWQPTRAFMPSKVRVRQWLQAQLAWH